MLTIAAMLGPRPGAADAPAMQLIGAARLAALMAAARMELGRERSRDADAPHSNLLLAARPRRRE